MTIIQHFLFQVTVSGVKLKDVMWSITVTLMLAVCHTLQALAMFVSAIQVFREMVKFVCDKVCSFNYRCSSAALVYHILVVYFSYISLSLAVHHHYTVRMSLLCE